MPIEAVTRLMPPPARPINTEKAASDWDAVEAASV